MTPPPISTGTLAVGLLGLGLITLTSSRTARSIVRTCIPNSLLRRVNHQVLLSVDYSSEKPAKNKWSDKQVCWLSENEGLPSEIWYEILRYLPDDRGNIASVCKELSRISRLFWNEDRIKNQPYKSLTKLLGNAESRVIDCIQNLPPEQIEILLKFSSVREWILSKLPSFSNKAIQTTILSALEPILVGKNNPWSEIALYKLYESEEQGEAVLAYLREVLEKLQTSIKGNPTTESLKKAITFGCPLNSLSQTDIPHLLFLLSFGHEPNDHLLAFSLIQNFPNTPLDKYSHNHLIELGIKKGHLALVDALTATRDHLQLTNCNGHSPLWLAVEYKQLKIAKLLLEKGANRKESDRYQTLASVAVGNNDLETLKLLVKEGDRDINNKACWLGTLLHKAARGGSIGIVRYLCELGADINNYLGKYSPLWLSINSNRGEIAAYLLRNGALFGEKEFITAAMEPASLPTFKLLWQYESNKPSPFQDFDFDELFFRAAENKNIEVFKLLCSLVKIPRDKKGCTLLHKICSWWSPQLIQRLIDHGWDVNDRDHFGYTPLHCVVSSNPDYLPAISTLLANKADVNARTNYGDFPLTKAIKVGNLQAVKLLLDAGANLTNETRDGKYALLLAAGEGSLELVMAILTKMAKSPYLDRNKHSALEVAIKAKKPEIVSFLLKEGAGFSEKIIKLAIKNEAFEVLEEFIRLNGVDFESQFGTLLFQAIRADKLNVIKFLKAHGANINFQPTHIFGLTPLQTAILKRNLPIVQWLVKEGADLFKGTPLEYAEANPWGNSEILEFLKQEIEKHNKKSNEKL